MFVWAHRGASGDYPENTLLAIEHALHSNADGIEIDVHEAHGQLWVIHDHWLERTTNGHGRLADNSIITISKLDAGLGQPIPTLAQVLKLVNGKLLLNIEMKSGDWPALLTAFLQQQLQNGYPATKLCVSSFDHVALAHFKQLLPAMPIGALIAHIPQDLAQCATTLQASSLNIAYDCLSPALIADAHRRQLQVNVYTVDHPEQLKELRALQVDGVFSNFPSRTRQWLDSIE